MSIKNNELMKRKTRIVTIDQLLSFMVFNCILSEKEAEIARRTGRLPDNILQRLEMADKSSKN